MTTEVILTDTHYSLPQNPVERENRLTEYLNSAYLVAQHASSQGASEIIHLGDVYDRNIVDDNDLLTLVQRIFSLWAEVCPVTVLVGNHDRQDREGFKHNLKILSLIEGVRVVETSYHDPDDKKLYLSAASCERMDANPQDSLWTVLKSVRTVYAHPRWDFVGKSPSLPQMCNANIQLFAGDLHTPLFISSGGAGVYAPGCFRIHSFRDVGDKGKSWNSFIIANFDEDHELVFGVQTPSGVVLDEYKLWRVENYCGPIYAIFEGDDPEACRSTVDKLSAHILHGREVRLLLRVPRDFVLPAEIDTSGISYKVTHPADHITHQDFSIVQRADINDLYRRYMTKVGVTDTETIEEGLRYLQ